MTTLNVVRFRLKGETFFPDQPFIRDISSPEALEGVADEADLFLIDGEGPLAEARDFLRRLRAHPASCAKPVFLPTSLGEEEDRLADGVVASLDEALRRGKEMVDRLALVNLPSLRESKDFRLLAYLFVRSNGEMEPHRYPFTPHVYGYPVAEALSDDEGDVFFWLRALRERNLLSWGELKDRIRLCPRCDCSHLNYIDICPNCGSIDIARREFIHCFTCGRVGPSEDFIQEHQMRCPFCSTRLRHLGSDYDHPLESHLCNDCGHRFVEADVVADCFCCRTRSRPDELVIDSIYGYRISETGKTSARVGSLEDVYVLLDRLNYVVPAYFGQLLDWLLLLNRRYSDANFSLIGLRLVNLAELSEKQGRQRVTQLIDALAGRLRELVRGTDVTTRTALSTLWILLPRTDRAGARTLVDRIAELKKLTVEGSGTALDFRLASFSSPSDVVDGDEAGRVLARLSGELEG